MALDVNLLGVLYFSRIACVYLRQNRKEGEDKSLLLVSSLAGFKESPGLFLYQVRDYGSGSRKLQSLTMVPGRKAWGPRSHAFLMRLPSRGLQYPSQRHLSLDDRNSTGCGN